MGNLLLQVGSCNCMHILNVEAVSGKQSILASTQIRSPTVFIQIVLCTSLCIRDGVAQSMTLNSSILPYSPCRRINPLQKQFDSGSVHQGMTYLFMLPGLNQKCYMAYLTDCNQPPQHNQQTLSIHKHTICKQLERVKHLNLAYFISTQEEIVSSQTFYNPLEARFLD